MNSVKINPKLSPSDQESSDDESETIKIHMLRQFSWSCRKCSKNKSHCKKESETKKFKSFEQGVEEGLILNILKNKNTGKKQVVNKI